MTYETPTFEILPYSIEDVLSVSTPTIPSKIPDTQVTDNFGDL